MTKRDDYVAVLLSKVGARYCNEGPWRCTGARGCWDCSGFACWGLNQIGVPYPCSNTDLMAHDLRRHGLLVSREVARRTKGCWVIRLTASHHMAISLGDGRVVEAASHASGVKIGQFDGRNWDTYGRPPGLNFGDDPVTDAEMDRVVSKTVAALTPVIREQCLAAVRNALGGYDDTGQWIDGLAAATYRKEHGLSKP